VPPLCFLRASVVNLPRKGRWIVFQPRRSHLSSPLTTLPHEALSRATSPSLRHFRPLMDYTYADVAKMIDHSLLNPTLTVADLDAGIELARAYDVASVCILPYYLKTCAERLAGTSVQPSTTIGFPHGGHTTAVKRAEAERAVAEGCTELDMVANISQVLSRNWDYVARDIAAVIEVAHAAGRKVKVIFENCYLQDEHKIRLCEICSELRADWVKTSTGYGTGGATHDDLRLMRRHSAPHVQVKAAGGVRDLDGLLAVRALGVTRCGASRTKDILDEARRRLGLPAIAAKATAVGGY
jgi:deoxyribose-phosphate aldolase